MTNKQQLKTDMKRIISLTIFAAMQLVCIAQENPKLESLYAYLKAKGLVKYYTLSNKNQEGLRKRYEFNFGLHDDGPAPIKDFMGRLLDAKEDSAVRAESLETMDCAHIVQHIDHRCVDLPFSKLDYFC